MVGSGNYTKFIMLDSEVHTSSKNLKVYTDAIAHHPNFVRIHRSYLVNKNFVKQIHKTNNQQWFVQMTKNEKLELSKGRIDEILEQLQN
jgi:two-component system LytT family response regulator